MVGTHFEPLSSCWPPQNNESLLHSRSVSPCTLSTPPTPGRDIVFLEIRSSVVSTTADLCAATAINMPTTKVVVSGGCNETENGGLVENALRKKKRKRDAPQTACASTQTNPCDLMVRNQVLLQSLEKLKEKVNRRMRRMLGWVQTLTDFE